MPRPFRQFQTYKVSPERKREIEELAERQRRRPPVPRSYSTFDRPQVSAGKRRWGK